MPKQKFTIFLMPLEEGGYQVFFPYYPSCVSDGVTVEEAIKHARDAMEGCLEADAKQRGDLLFSRGDRRSGRGGTRQPNRGPGRGKNQPPPATAGTMLISSPELVEVSNPWRNRTSSPLR